MESLKNKQNRKFTFTTRQIAIVGVLMALGLALSRVSIPLGTTNRLSLGFIVNAVLGMLYGPWVAGFAAAGVDLLVSFIFGNQGTFFIGFTFSAFVGGFIYGLFLHRKNVTWKHVLAAVLLVTLISNIILNTLWIYILYQTPVSVLLVSRLTQNLIMAPIRFGVLYFITQNRQLNQVFDRYATERR